MDTNTPTIKRLKIGCRQHGVAGQYGYMVTVLYSTGELCQTLFSAWDAECSQVFIGINTRIDDAVRERCGGILTPAFIRKFYRQS